MLFLSDVYFRSIFSSQGPMIEKLSPPVNAGLDCFLNLMKDENSHVREQLLGLSRSFEMLDIISSENLQKIVLLQSIIDVPQNAENGSRAIYDLARGFESASSSLLSLYLMDMITSLIASADRTDSSHSKLRTSAYETIDEVVRCSNLVESSHTIVQLLPVIINKLQQTLDLQIVSSDDRKSGVICKLLSMEFFRSSSRHLAVLMIQDLQAAVALFANQIMVLFMPCLLAIAQQSTRKPSSSQSVLWHMLLVWNF